MQEEEDDADLTTVSEARTKLLVKTEPELQVMEEFHAESQGKKKRNRINK